MSPMQRLLLGTWRSDRSRTLKTWHKYYLLRGAKKRRFAALFGKLELRYTQQFVYHELRDFKYKERYEVIAEDSESIVIRVSSEGIKQQIDDVLLEGIEGFFTPKLHQIHFRRLRGRQYYWIGQGTFCEWFQKPK